MVVSLLKSATTGPTSTCWKSRSPAMVHSFFQLTVSFPASVPSYRRPSMVDSTSRSALTMPDAFRSFSRIRGPAGSLQFFADRLSAKSFPRGTRVPITWPWSARTCACARPPSGVSCRSRSASRSLKSVKSMLASRISMRSTRTGAGPAEPGWLAHAEALLINCWLISTPRRLISRITFCSLNSDASRGVTWTFRTCRKGTRPTEMRSIDKCGNGSKNNRSDSILTGALSCSEATRSISGINRPRGRTNGITSRSAAPMPAPRYQRFLDFMQTDGLGIR